MEVFTTNSAKETQKLAKKILQKKRRVIGLVGDLGSGKTTFAQGLAKALGIKERVISPTFVLVRQYQIPKTRDQRLETKLYHVDLYRLDDKIDILSLGLPEIWAGPQNLVVIEWAEKIKIQLPKEALIIKFKKLGEEKREIRLVNRK